MILGYVVTGPDNDSYMLDGVNLSEAGICHACGLLLNFEYHNPDLKLRRATFDLSHCYDLGIIVSLRFKEFCIRHDYTGIRFSDFRALQNNYQLFIDNKIELDVIKRKIQFIKKCKHCHRYKEVIGATPAFLKNEEPIPNGFFASDLLFGSDNSKNPIMIVGSETREKLQTERIKGLWFEPIYTFSHWNTNLKPKPAEPKKWYQFW
ncbi:hypothetical protein ACFQ21_14285 [Ohtaekwangia kribbensis]|uniref:Uncharacterized protein n=1 Tax=Ohtaekwangia kribbensis TaxID=688913 RepID=A0ABW3K2S1_9BACT